MSRKTGKITNLTVILKIKVTQNCDLKNQNQIIEIMQFGKSKSTSQAFRDTVLNKKYHRVAIASKFKIENILIEKLNVFDLFLRSSSEKITSY